MTTSGVLPVFVTLAATLLGVAAALSAYRRQRVWAYGAAKAVASAGFVAAALVAGLPAEAWARWAVAALVLSASGDVALAVRGRGGFLAGLSAFLLAHAAYTVGFVRLSSGAAALLASVLVAAGVAAIAGRTLRGRVPDGLRPWVAVYAVVLAAMLATGVVVGLTHGRPWLALGSLLVAGSDVAVARERFGRPGFVNKLVGLPTYYLGQTLIAWSVAGTV